MLFDLDADPVVSADYSSLFYLLISAVRFGFSLIFVTIGTSVGVRTQRGDEVTIRTPVDGKTTQGSNSGWEDTTVGTSQSGLPWVRGRHGEGGDVGGIGTEVSVSSTPK